MSRELIEIMVFCGWVLVNRLWSHLEHKKGRKDIQEIRIYMNGEVERRLQEAYERGRADERLKSQSGKTGREKRK